MGVKGLFQFLKRFEKSVNVPQFVEGKTVGIDIFWFLYQSKGDMFYLQNYLLPILKNAKKVYCVFDGAAAEMKWEYLKQQAEKRRELNRSIQEIERFIKYPFNRLTRVDRNYIYEYLNQLKRQVWQPSPEYIEHVKCWLQAKGCEIYQAEGEADDVLIELEKRGDCEVLITNDSDMLIHGTKILLRPSSPLRGTVFEINSLCMELKFTAQQWSDFMYLCRYINDDILIAYSLISVYKDIDYIMQKYDFNSCYKEQNRIQI